MKKALVLLMAVLCLTVVSNAQKNNISLNAGAVIALPMGSFGDVYDMGFGATVRGELPFSKQLVGIATVGFLTWSGDMSGFGTTIDYKTTAIPVRAGAKYYFDKKGTGLYGIGELGLHFYSSTVEGGGMNLDASSTEFALALGGGYELPVSKTMMLDLSGEYVVVSESNYLEIRAGLKFPLGK